MTNLMTHHSEEVAGTVGGTLLAVLTVSSEDMLHTIILASLGAIVSFVVSMLAKKLYNYVLNKFKKK